MKTDILKMIPWVFSTQNVSYSNPSVTVATHPSADHVNETGRSGLFSCHFATC